MVPLVQGWNCKSDVGVRLILLLVQVVCLSAVDILQRTSGLKQFCQTEVFDAQCADDEVIMMALALYGRMRISRCVTTDYGHVGCKKDVLVETDKRCSGKHSCQVRIPDAQFDVLALGLCPVEFKTYFEAEFSCITVATANQQVCQSVGAITLTSPSGYLANAITDATGVGSTSCPWKISMSPGQRINITLYDFSRPLLTEKRNINSRSSPCVRYAIIREQTMSVHNIPICGEKRRIRPVYISTGSTVDVSITRRSNQQFVLEYKAIGCRYLEPQEHGWIKYDDHKTLRAIVRCNHTSESWVLHCQGTSWIGARANCSEGPSPERPGVIVWGQLSLPYGVSVGIIIGLAVIVGVIILLVGLICLEWKKMKPGEPEEDSRGTTETGSPRGVGKESQYVKQGEMVSHEARLSRSGPVTSQVTATAIRDNDYAYMREMWPMALPPTMLNHPDSQEQSTSATSQKQIAPPPYPYSGNVNRNAISTNISPESESEEAHIYESPTSLRRASRDPHYFQLDPEVARGRENGSVKGPRPVRMTITTTARPNGGPDGESSPRTPLDETQDNHRVIVGYGREV